MCFIQGHSSTTNSFQELPSTTMETCSQSLGVNTRLKTVSIGSEDLRRSHFFTFAQSFSQGSKLVELIYVRNSSGNNFLILGRTLLKNEIPRSIKVERYPVGPASPPMTDCWMLGEALARNCSMERITLSGSELSDEECSAILDRLDYIVARLGKSTWPKIRSATWHLPHWRECCCKMTQSRWSKLPGASHTTKQFWIF